MFLLRLIFLVLGTAAGLFYILMMLRGRKYEGLVASLDKETFSNKDLCGAGFAMQEIGPFTLRGKLGKTFLVVMHELPEVLRCADRIVVLDGGHLVYNGDAAGCLAENIPQRYFQIHLSGSAEDGYAVRPLSPSEKQI